MIGGDGLYFIFSFLTYCLVQRYNVLLGIPDFLFISVSYSMLSLLGELIIMPMLSLACIVCPKNLEASVYSYFLSLVNFSSILSSLIGALLTYLLGIKANNFDNLPVLVLIANFTYILPLIWLLWLKESYFSPEKEKQNKIDKEAKQDVLDIQEKTKLIIN